MEVNQGGSRRRAGRRGVSGVRWASPPGASTSSGAASALSRRGLQELSPTGGISLLVIDAEPDMRERLSVTLPPGEFEVVTADGGRAAVELLATRRFDVALTDLKASGTSGVETVAVLRQLDPDMEVIVATSYASLEAALACMKQGAYDYIRKPCDVDELRHVVLRAVEKRRLRSLVPLYEVSCALLSLRTRAEVLTHLGELALDLVPHHAFRLLLPEPGTGELTVCSCPDGLEVPVEALRELAGRAIQRQEPVSLARAAWDWPFATVAQVGSALAYPLQVGSAPAGGLILLRGLGQPAFSASELQRGSLFSAQLALALETARRNGELETRVKELTSTREELVKVEKLATAGKLAAGLAHELSNPLAFTKASLQALTVYSRSVRALTRTSREVAEELAASGDPRLAALARRLFIASGADTELSLQDAADAAEDAIDGIRRVEGLLTELRALSGNGPMSRAERLDVTGLLGAWAEQGCLSRPIQVEAPVPVLTQVGRAELENSLGRILTFLCEGARARPDAPPVVVRAVYQDGCPLILVEDPLLELSEARRLEIFDPRIQEDAHGGRTMRLNLGLAMAYQLLRRMGADLSVLPGASGGSLFRLVLPVAP